MSNRPLQPGDLCLIVGATQRHKTTVGKSCVLIKHAPAGTPLHKGLIYPIDAWNVSLDGDSDYHIAEKWLMRIDGNPDAESDQIKQQKPEAVHG